MAETKMICPGTVIQVTDEKNKLWFGCLMIVSEIKDFGIKAYMRVPGKGNAILPLKWNQFEIVGPAVYAEAEAHAAAIGE